MSIRDEFWTISGYITWNESPQYHLDSTISQDPILLGVEGIACIYILLQSKLYKQSSFIW